MALPFVVFSRDSVFLLEAIFFHFFSVTFHLHHWSLYSVSKSRRFRVGLRSKHYFGGTFPIPIPPVFHKQCPYFPLPSSKTIMCKDDHFEIGVA